MSGIVSGGVQPAAEIASPVEVMIIILEGLVDTALVSGGIIAAGADDDSQQAGCVTVLDAGEANSEKYADVVWKRMQLRCMGADLDHADRIGNHVADIVKANGERMLVKDSDGRTWLVHEIQLAVSPSHHIDSSETWESLLFATITMGTVPVEVET